MASHESPRLGTPELPLKASTNKSEKRHLRSKNRNRYGDIPIYTFDFDYAFPGSVRFDEKIPVISLIQNSKDGDSNGGSLHGLSNSVKSDNELTIQKTEPIPSSTGLSSSSLNTGSTSSNVNTLTFKTTSHKTAALSTNGGVLPACSNRPSNQKTVFTLFSYAGIPTGRRHTPDPLAASTFETFHRHMSRVEKRSRLQERERSASEHARLTQIKEELNGSLWKNTLPMVTRVQNARSKAEMDTKKKKTLEEIDYFLKRYSRFKAVEKKTTQAANAAVIASANAGIGITDSAHLAHHGNGSHYGGSSRKRKGKPGKDETLGVTHNTFDEEEPGVDSVSSENEGHDYFYPHDGADNCKYRWEYDGLSTGIRATQK